MASEEKESKNNIENKESNAKANDVNDNEAEEMKKEKAKSAKKKSDKKEKAKKEKEPLVKKEEQAKKEKLEKRRKVMEEKKKLAEEEKARKKYKKLLKLPEPSQQMLRAVGGGLMGVLAQIALTYILWGIATDESILYAGFIIDVSSMGNPFNALAGVWALSFTPLTVIDKIMLNWTDLWLYIFIPILVAGVIVGITGKRLFTCLIGGLFFIFWGIMIPLIMTYMLSIFGIMDPAIIDGFLFPLLNEPMSNWNYGWLYNLFNNIFVSWSIAGTLEIGLIVTGIASLIGFFIQLIR